MATDLYRRTIAFEYGNTETSALTRKVWEPTPWMIDMYTGHHPFGDPRERQILDWCYDELGEESSPIHGHTGRWHRGSATVNGRTWFGFATETDMQRFLAAWPAPEGVKQPGVPVGA
jgi:hypothetical protein